MQTVDHVTERCVNNPYIYPLPLWRSWEHRATAHPLSRNRMYWLPITQLRILVSVISVGNTRPLLTVCHVVVSVHLCQLIGSPGRRHTLCHAIKDIRPIHAIVWPSPPLSFVTQVWVMVSSHAILSYCFSHAIVRTGPSPTLCNAFRGARISFTHQQVPAYPHPLPRDFEYRFPVIGLGVPVRHLPFIHVTHL